MIQANELRIGNWVFDEIGNEYVQICGIDPSLNDIWANLSNGAGQYKRGLSKISPIPLTEEILLKCGFEYREPFPNIRGVLYKDNFEIGLDGDDFRLNQMSVRIDKAIIIKVNHLHQLQNLYYALTGVELEVNL